MYTIKQAAARSGVGVSLLRAWERRYGVVSPVRTPSGYRLYDEEDIARLRSMRQLVDGGWHASQAAEAVRNGQVELSRVPGTGITAAVADTEAFLSAAEAFDVAALEGILDVFFSRGSYETVIEELVLPAVVALGDAWAAGRIDVAAEHLASAAVQRRLSVLFGFGGAAGSGRTVAVGLPPHGHHEIGTLAFSVALRRQGVNVLYLGPDVPVSSWAHVVSERALSAAVLGVTISSDVPGADEITTAIREVRPGLIVGVGGRAARETGAGARILPDRVSAAAVEVAGLSGRS